MAKAKKDNKVVSLPAAQATHVLLPVEVFNALTQLIGSKIPWGDADQIMTLVKQNVKMHTPKVKEDEPIVAS